MSATPEADQLAAAHMRVLEMFGAFCADPDNTEVGAQADQALLELDRLLALTTT